MTKERFDLEARAAAKLSHPNVVSVFHAGTERDVHFIVMELISGESLEDKLHRVKRLPVEIALSYCLDICKALDYAERHGIVHRDLKPGNILIDHDGSAKLADLGLVKMESDARQHHTFQGAAMGTPHYMAPEQVRDAKGVDHRADLYSLGCTLFQMVCGRTVFEANDVKQLLNAHLREDVPEAEEFNEDLPPGLSKLIKQLLHKEPEQRISSAASLEREIYTLFDQWSTLPTPIVLPQQKNRSRVTYHLHSLDLERKKTRKLTWTIIALTMTSLLTILGIYFIDTKPVGSALSSSEQVKVDAEKAFLRASRAEQIALKVERSIGTASSRLITSPEHAAEHYWNAMIHRNDRNWRALADALWASFKAGYRHYDIAVEIFKSLERSLGAQVAAQVFTEHRSELKDPALELTFLVYSRHNVHNRNYRSLLRELEQLSKETPSYLPIYYELLNILSGGEVKRHISLLELLTIDKDLEERFKALQIMTLEKTLETFYFSDQSIAAFIQELKQQGLRNERKTLSLEKPIRQIITPSQDELQITANLGGNLYSEFTRLRYALIPHSLQTQMSGLPKLIIDQRTLLPIAEKLEFTGNTNPHLSAYEQIVSFKLKYHFKGRLLFELTDRHKLKSYISVFLDTDQELLKSYLPTLKSDRWYEIPAKGAQLSALLIAYPQYLELKFYPIIFTYLRPLLSKIKIELKSRDEDKLIASDDITNVSQLSQMPNLTFKLEEVRWSNLQKLQPQVSLILSLTNGERYVLKAPLSALFMSPPKDVFDH